MGIEFPDKVLTEKTLTDKRVSSMIKFSDYFQKTYL